MIFQDRQEAGIKLAGALDSYAQAADTVVLGLPRGGVVIAYEIARLLHLPLDVFLVRKLGVPGQEELAFGAISEAGGVVYNEGILAHCQISQITIEKIIRKQQILIKKRLELYRNYRAGMNLNQKTLILADDGIATGATLNAAIKGLKASCQPKKIIIAVPVAAKSNYDQFKQQVDKIICLHSADYLSSIGQFYINFSQVTDAQVQQFLEKV